MAVPSTGFGPCWATWRPTGEVEAVIVLAKGIENGTNLRMSEVIAQVLPEMPAGVLDGPQPGPRGGRGPTGGQRGGAGRRGVGPTGPVLGPHPHLPGLHGHRRRRAVRIAGATKNVMAIAAGICDGSGFGENTRAVLITRGLAELGRLGVSSGGAVLTFGGLAGVGDLVATCASPKSRNRTVGYELGLGRTLADITAGMHMVAEGVKSAGPLVELAHAHGVEMPIAEQVRAIVEGRCSPKEALLDPDGPPGSSRMG